MYGDSVRVSRSLRYGLSVLSVVPVLSVRVSRSLRYW